MGFGSGSSPSSSGDGLRTSIREATTPDSSAPSTAARKIHDPFERRLEQNTLRGRRHAAPPSGTGTAVPVAAASGAAALSSGCACRQPSRISHTETIGSHWVNVK